MEAEPYSVSTEKLIEGQGQPQIQQMQPQVQQQMQPQVQQQPSSSFSIFFWKFFSVISWVLLIFTSLEAYRKNTSLFLIYERNTSFYLPISINMGMLQSFFLIILFLGFFNFAYLGLYKGDYSIIDPLFTSATKFHSLPLLLVSFINISLQTIKNSSDNENIKGQFIEDLVFTCIALGLLVYVYIKTNLQADWFSILTIKKGLFSSLIIILWYNLFYTSIIIGIINNQRGDIYSFLKGAGISFSILVGFGSLIFSLVFKDVIAAVTNLLIYIGMVCSFFGMKGKTEELRYLYGGVADGVIEIIIMVLNLVVILLLIFSYNAQLTENKFATQ